MKEIGIVYHSGYGHTEVVAKKVFEGCSAVGSVKVKLFSVSEFFDEKTGEAKMQELSACGGIIFGCPTYMGCVSADFKKFMDLSSKVWFSQGWKDKLASGFTNSHGLSGDKLNTLFQLANFAAQQSMIWVSQGIFPSETLNRLGFSLGLGTCAANVEPQKAFDQRDLDTAVAFGKRFAEVFVKSGF